MAVEMITWARRQVFDRFELSGPERFVLMLLADNASFDDESGLWSAFPLQNTLAQESGFNERTVQRALRRFRDLGLVSMEPRYKKTGAKSGNTYRFHPERVMAPIVRTEAVPDMSSHDRESSLEFSSHDTESGLENSSHDTQSGRPSEAREFKPRHTVGSASKGDLTRQRVGYHPTQSRVPRAKTNAGASLTVNEPSSSSSGSSDCDQDMSPDGTGETTTKTARASHDETGGARSQVRFGMYRPGNATGTVNLDRVATTVTGWGITPDRDRLIWLVEAICDRSARAVHSPGSFVRTALRGQSGLEWAQAIAEEFVADDRPDESDQGSATSGHGRGQKAKCPVPGHAASGYLRVNCPECRIHHAWPSVLDWEIYAQMTTEIRALVDAEPAVTVTESPDATADSVRTHGDRTPVTTARSRPSGVRTADRTAAADEVEVTESDRDSGHGHRRAG